MLLIFLAATIPLSEEAEDYACQRQRLAPQTAAELAGTCLPAAIRANERAGHDEIPPLLIPVFHKLAMLLQRGPPSGSARLVPSRARLSAKTSRAGNTPKGVLCLGSRLQYSFRYGLK